jgi:hypothetical protein
VQRAINDGVDKGYNYIMSEILKKVISEGVHISESPVKIKEEG